MTLHRNEIVSQSRSEYSDDTGWLEFTQIPTVYAEYVKRVYAYDEAHVVFVELYLIGTPDNITTMGPANKNTVFIQSSASFYNNTATIWLHNRDFTSGEFIESVVDEGTLNLKDKYFIASENQTRLNVTNPKYLPIAGIIEEGIPTNVKFSTSHGTAQAMRFKVRIRTLPLSKYLEVEL